MECVVCNKPLNGNLDTFGERGLEMCWEHWSIAGDEPELAMTDSFYGLGPHEHSYDENGQIIIGGTKFLPLGPSEDGLHRVNGMWFLPDPESDGCGTYFRDKSSAFRFELLVNGIQPE